MGHINCLCCCLGSYCLLVIVSCFLLGFSLSLLYFCYSYCVSFSVLLDGHGHPHAWARGHGKGALAPSPGSVEKCSFLLQMLSKTSVAEVFMHHFEKCRQLLGASPPYPPGLSPGPCWRTSVLQTPSLPTPGKKSCGRPC